jgi:integrase
VTILASPLAPHLERFLEYKRALGYAYRDGEWMAQKLDRLAIDAGLKEPVITEAFIRQFVSSGADGARAERLSVARQFSRFLASDLPQTFVPHRLFLGVRRRKPVVHVLSRQEASRFLIICGSLADKPTSRTRWLIHGTALWTLLMTGLRRGEALGLADEDVDLAANVITVRCGKFGKSRFVPFARDVAVRLQRYRDLRDALMARRPMGAFFPSADGLRACNGRYLYGSFRTALRIAGIPHHGRGDGPRLHDLRHTFACLRLLAWYEDGADLQAKLPLLATYLGHVGLKSTQTYLHMTRDFVGEVVQRQRRRFGDLITAQLPNKRKEVFPA